MLTTIDWLETRARLAEARQDVGVADVVDDDLAQVAAIKDAIPTVLEAGLACMQAWQRAAELVAAEARRGRAEPAEGAETDLSVASAALSLDDETLAEAMGRRAAAAGARWVTEARTVLEAFARGYFGELVAGSSGNISAMARASGLQRTNVRRWLKTTGLRGGGR